MKKLAVLAIAGLMSVTASAANWVATGFSKDRYGNLEDTAYVDTESIAISGRYRTAFVQLKFTNDVFMPEFNLRYNSITLFKKFDCQSTPLKDKGLTGVVKQDNVIVHSISSESEWEFTFPDSVGEATAKFVCSYQK